MTEPTDETPPFATPTFEVAPVQPYMVTFDGNRYTFFAEPFEGILARADAALDRMLRPWMYPQAPRLPEIDLFPRLTRWEDRLKRWRKRVTDIVYVARHGLPEREDYDW